MTRNSPLLQRFTTDAMGSPLGSFLKERRGGSSSASLLLLTTFILRMPSPPPHHVPVTEQVLYLTPPLHLPLAVRNVVMSLSQARKPMQSNLPSISAVELGFCPGLCHL